MRRILLVAAVLGALVGALLGATWAELQLVFDDNSANRFVYFSPPKWLMPWSVALAAFTGTPLGLVAGVAYGSLHGGRKRFAVVLAAGAVLGALVPFLLAWSPPNGRPLLPAVTGMLLTASLHWIVVWPFTVRDQSTRRRWSQFSLRGMFAAVAVFGVALNIYISQPVQRWRVRAALVERGYVVEHKRDVRIDLCGSRA